MAKKRAVKKKSSKNPPPSSLTMRLFDPGMSILHRAGLGGLACTLKYIERAWQLGALTEDELPGGPWTNDQPPWKIDRQSVTLDFGEPENAGEYLKRLFALAFQIEDGVIYLPGQYGTTPPHLGIRAALQEGLLLSFYDHGPQARSIDAITEYTVDVDGTSATFSTVTLDWYKHQRDGAALAEKSLTKEQVVTRILHPGAIQRHVTVGRSKITEPAERLIPLLFGPIGTFCLKAGGKRVKDRNATRFKPGAVVVIPAWRDLTTSQSVSEAMLPQSMIETRIQSTGDAVLGAELRVRSRLATEVLHLDFRAVWCCPTDWNARLQPPSQVFELRADDLEDETLGAYEIARAELPPRIRSKTRQETKGRGKNKTVKEVTEWFWTDSVIRPLIADNLARGQLWYDGFRDLFVATNPRNNRPLRDNIPFEKKGLHAMTEMIPWKDAGERIVVRAVHEALRRQYGKIAAEPRLGPEARVKKWQNEYNRLRIAFSGAKTADRVRFVLCDLFARAGINEVLQRDWPEILPFLAGPRWLQVRDLALLALASYRGAGVRDVQQPVEDSVNDSDKES